MDYLLDTTVRKMYILPASRQVAAIQKTFHINNPQLLQATREQKQKKQLTRPLPPASEPRSPQRIIHPLVK